MCSGGVKMGANRKRTFLLACLTFCLLTCWCQCLWGETSPIDRAPQSGSSAIGNPPGAMVNAEETATPTATPFPHLISVIPDQRIPLEVGPTYFTFRYSDDMDTTADVSVTFGMSAPYDEYSMLAAPGWVGNKTWVGRVEVTAEMAIGVYTFRVSGAKTESGLSLPDDTDHSILVGAWTPTPTVTATGTPTQTRTPIPGGLHLRIDLDRSTEAIESARTIDPSGELVEGRVVLTGLSESDLIGPAYGIAVNVGGLPFVPTASSVREGDATGGGTNPFISPAGDQFFLSYVDTHEHQGPANGIFSLVEFDLQFGDCNQGSVAEFSFLPSSQGGGQIGIALNGYTAGIIDGDKPIPIVGATVICGETGPTNTPTEATTPIPCEDTGYHILDSFGGRHSVGDPAGIEGTLYFGHDVARDMERAVTGAPASVPDLAVLDSYGAVRFVQNPEQTPDQGFYFPDIASAPCGFAVDVEIANSNDGFWVLTEQGSIYRAGSALPNGAPADDPLGGDAVNLCTFLGIPFVCPGNIGGPERNTGLPCPDDLASVRAVGFVVVQSADPAAPAGYVILDSQGGHYTFDADGNVLDDEVEGSILNEMGGATETAYPFWAGLDIGRDIELHPAGGSTHGLVIYDGWGGVHPVPVNETANSRVSFLRNEGPSANIVGLPYIKAGFDDPTTPELDESPSFDVSSVFTDIEFCATGHEGVYVLDRFGGVFAPGATRLSADSSLPMFTGGPYFHPNLYARDLEAEGLFHETPFGANR